MLALTKMDINVWEAIVGAIMQLYKWPPVPLRFKQLPEIRVGSKDHGIGDKIDDKSENEKDHEAAQQSVVIASLSAPLSLGDLFFLREEMENVPNKKVSIAHEKI